jgi:hypothetical protein
MIITTMMMTNGTAIMTGRLVSLSLVSDVGVVEVIGVVFSGVVDVVVVVRVVVLLVEAGVLVVIGAAGFLTERQK